MPPTILVVESNFDLAEVIQMVLLGHGYNTLAVQHNQLFNIPVEPQRIAMVLCEIDCPAARGRFREELSRFAASHSLPVLYSTGSEIPNDIDIGNILQKPFSVETLLDVVATRLKTENP